MAAAASARGWQAFEEAFERAEQTSAQLNLQTLTAPSKEQPVVYLEGEVLPLCDTSPP